MLRPAEVLVLLAGFAACEQKPKPAAVDVSGSATTTIAPQASSVAPVAAAPPDAGAAWSCDDPSLPRSGKSIGHTSVVYKLELASGKRFAWKPNAKKVKGRYKGEIAAYRLGKALELRNVVPACARTFRKDSVATAIPSLNEEIIVEDDKIRGVIIPWISELKFWPLEKEPLATDLKTWLTAGKNIPEAQRGFAEQVSTLVVFDYLTGNWDRYSGENVGLDRSGKLVLFIDNDAAFMTAPPPDADRKNLARVRATDRFSRKLVEKLRVLTLSDLAEIFGEEEPGRELLAVPVRAAMWGRLTRLRTLIDEKIAANGEAETLFFP